MRLLHVANLESVVNALDHSLGVQERSSRSIFDLLLIQQDATKTLKEEVDRLERELAMAEEQIHVLTPARDPLGRFSPSHIQTPSEGARLYCSV